MFAYELVFALLPYFKVFFDFCLLLFSFTDYISTLQLFRPFLFRPLFLNAQDILRRIQHAEPTYDHVAWLEDARRHEGYLKNMCELPLVIGPLSAEGEVQRTQGGTRTGGGGAAQQQIEYE